MTKLTTFLIACVAGCGHVTNQSPNAPVPPIAAAADPVTSDLDLPPPEQLPDLSVLRLALKQVSSNSEMAFELALTNTGHVPVKITANPHFGHRSFDGERENEFEIQLIDGRGRWIPFQCTECFGLYQAEIAVLQPGQTRAYPLSLMPACYSLVPGERLSFIATYANLFGQNSRHLKNLPVVHAASWIEVVVPAGWPDRGAARQGVADGASSRR